jgi:AraC family transcriptional regulator
MIQASTPFRHLMPPPVSTGAAPGASDVSIELYHLGDVEFNAAHAEHLVSVQQSPVHLYQRRGTQESERRLAKGAIVVTPAGGPKTWRRHGEGDLLVIALAPRLLDALLREATGREGIHAHLLDNFGTRDARLEAIAWALWAESREPGIGSDIVAEALVRQLGMELLRHYCAPTPDARRTLRIPPHKLREAEDYINAHLADRLQVAAIARAVGMSPFHFAHAFREATGMPPHQYVVRRRLERAKALLASGSLSLGEIAQRVGYSSQSHFSVAFHKALGVAPSLFRKR